MPAVLRSVALISSAAAALPLHAYSSAGATRTMLTSGPEADLLANPHPDMTPFELWELGYMSALTSGNAAFFKLRDQSGRLVELWWIDQKRIKYGRANDLTKVYVVDGKTDEPLTDREILHVPGMGYDGVCGFSPIRLAREGLGLALAAEEYGARLFGSGSLHTGILSTEQKLHPDQAEELRQRWKAVGSGLESAHDVRVLGQGAKFQQISIPPEDAQFIETRRFQIAEVARIFGIPPHMLFETEKSTSWGSGIEEQNIGFVTYTLRPWLTRFEQRVTQALRVTATPRPPRPSSVYAKYSVEGLLRGDSKARSAFYRELWGIGALSTNDIRSLEDWAPVEGGDVRYVPLNMGELGAAAATTGGEPAPGADDFEEDAGEAIDLLRQVYLSVGKVVTVEEARALVSKASGVQLPVIDSAEVFSDMPPAPVPGQPEQAGGDDPAPDITHAPEPDAPAAGITRTVSARWQATAGQLELEGVTNA
jgi:HK97 family phage portal protein